MWENPVCENRTTVDATRNDTLLPLFSGLPRLSSEELLSEKIVVEYYYLSPNDIPEVSQRELLISLQLARRYSWERWENGTFQQGCSRTGDIHIVPPEVPRRLRWSDPLEVLAIRVNADFVLRIAREFAANFVMTARLGLHDPFVEQIGWELKGELEAGCPGGSIYGESLGTALTVHLLTHYCSSDCQADRKWKRELPKSKLRRLTDYINSNLDKEITLANMAAIVGMSPYHFAHLFKNSTGCAPHRYLTKRRIEHAKMLLNDSDLPIIEICERSGFQNQSHFATQFRRYTGVTPREYRNSL